MSAYIVDRLHIDLMVALARRGPCDAVKWYAPRWRSGAGGAFDRDGLSVAAHELGSLLVAENVASVAYRYPNDRLDQLPGPRPIYWLVSDAGHGGYRYIEQPMLPTAVETLKLISCYEYQSCEHPGWADSEPIRFCEALRQCAIACLPGYREAPWSWSAETLAERRGGA